MILFFGMRIVWTFWSKPLEKIEWLQDPIIHLIYVYGLQRK